MSKFYRALVVASIALAAVSLLLSLRTGSVATIPETALNRVNRTRTLNVGFVVYPPTVVKDPKSGKLSGHFVEAIRFIGNSAGWKVQFHELQFSTFAAALQSGQIDISIAATYRTIPRATAVAFTRPLIYIGNGAIVRADENRFDALRDFNDPEITLAVAQGEASHEYATAHFPLAKLKVLSTSDLTLPLAEVLAGRADVGLADAWTTSQFSDRNSSTVKDLFDGQPYDVTPIGWAVRHGDTDLLNFFNTAIDYCESTGRLRDWEDQYDAHWLRPEIEFAVE